MKKTKKSFLTPFKAIKYLFMKPITFKFPFQTREASQRYRGFHLNDWGKCTGCGNCADICPNQAITMTEIPEIKTKEGEKNERPQIDYGRCCFCGLCVDICPPGSLRLSRDYIHIDHANNSFTYLPKDEKTDAEHFMDGENYSIFQASLDHRKKDYEGFVSDLDFTLFDPKRIKMPIIPADERKNSFIEEVIGYSKEEAKRESLRCLECKLCEEACPAHMKISDYIKAIHDDKPAAALKKIYEDNPLPAICGRICMKHCENVCSLSIRGEALSIRWLKRYASDTIADYKTALELKPFRETGKKVAVIGAGPSGLSEAYFLRLKGYEVTVFDSLPEGGGMMLIGPPPYRLPVESVEKDVNYITSLGAKFKFNTKVGKDILFEDILKSYDAVYIAIGTHLSRSTRVKNSEKCMLALDFLTETKIGNATKVGKNIIVIGGGNVALDVAREALRLQHIQYPDEETVIKTMSLENWDEMPATEEEIEGAKEEGVIFNPAWGPKEVKLDEKGNVSGISCIKVKSVFDENGRFHPTFYEEKQRLLEADMIIEAIGQGPDFSFIPEKLMKKLEFTERRKLKIDENGQTSIPKVFGGGAIVNTNLDAITAIADAKLSAEGIDNLLLKK